MDDFVLYAIHVLVIGRWLYCEYLDFMAARIYKRINKAGIPEIAEAIRKNIK